MKFYDNDNELEIYPAKDGIVKIDMWDGNSRRRAIEVYATPKELEKLINFLSAQRALAREQEIENGKNNP